MEHGHCRHLLASLSDYVDGVLEEKLCAELERHLEGCENCQVVVDSLLKTISLYQVIEASSTIPADVRQRLYHCLELDEFFSPSDATGAM